MRISFDRRCGIEHRLALFLDVNRAVLAGELAEIFLGGLQIRLHGFEALLEKLSLSSRRGGGKLRHLAIELFYVSLCKSSGASGVAGPSLRW